MRNSGIKTCAVDLNIMFVLFITRTGSISTFNEIDGRKSTILRTPSDPPAPEVKSVQLKSVPPQV